MRNILTEPLIRMETASGPCTASLPEVYVALMRDAVDAFPALRPHQRHAWHAFLVQLAAMSLHRAGISEPPDDAAEWTTLIRGLTPDWPDDEPWQLVVDDITKPAFMQPPAHSAGKRAEYKHTVATPDELDMLVTAKNHDLKSSIGSDTRADDWLFALVDLQTMAGYDGSSNFGVSRMNGGLGSRPAFTLAPSQRTGAHVKRDIEALLPDYSEPNGGIALLWTIPWNGSKEEPLLPNCLEPLYIEICRRIRLCSDASGQLYGIRAGSKAARIENKDIKGRTGDPWTPINQKRDGLPLTLGGGGFTYKRVTDYLTAADWGLPALLNPTPEEQRSPEPAQLVARAMVRGQGKTEGYYERTIPIRTETRKAMMGRARTEDLGAIAQKRIEQVAIVQRILSHAIQTFVARGDSSNASPEHRARARPWLNRLDEIVDVNFFDQLQEEFVADVNEREGIHNTWLMGVVNNARNILHDAEDALPCPAIHRYRARVAAEGLFEGRIRGASGLPFLFTEQGGEDD